jgi:hypothetical protein
MPGAETIRKHTDFMAKKKTSKTPSAPAVDRAVSRSQFWVIDTDTPGQSQGQFSASGPFATMQAAEEFIIEDIRALWEDSCTCLTSSKTDKWCKPLHIVKICRTVEPEIKPTIKLVDTANTELNG